MNARNDAWAGGQGRVYQASGDQHITEHHHHAPDATGPDSVRHPAVSRAPAVLRDRVGEMDRLRQAVEPGVGNGVYVLHGLGGCGKTAVALTLFQYATREAGRIGLWVNTSDSVSLRAGMLAVAADRGATDGELVGARSGLRPAADLVWQYLDRSEQPWLLVLDNADNPGILREGGWLRTSPTGTVVVTTRQAAPHWWPGAELLQFGVLPREDAALVLRDLAPHAGSAEEAADVADRLGRLPLALTLAGGFLSHQVIDPWTLADYRRRLDGGVAGLDAIDLIDQGDTTFGADSRHLLSSTWQLSLDALAAQGLQEAGDLLRLLACWSSDPLPLSILSGAELSPELPSFKVESALRGLLDHSLTGIVSADETRCLRTHGVVLESVARTASAEQREQLADTASRLLLAALPEIPDRGPQGPLVNLLAPHVTALLSRTAHWAARRTTVESAAECALRLATAVHRSGDYVSALALAEEAVETARPALGEDHALLTRLRQRVARSLFRLGRFEESEALYLRVLEICERTLGPKASDTLTTRLKLASPLINTGREEEGQALIQQIVQERTTLLGPTHPLTLLARASFLESATRPAELDAGSTLIADCRREAGDDHSITLDAQLNYACALQRAGRSADALPHVDSALEGYVRRFGSDYPIALNARLTLSRVLNALARTPEAIEHAEQLVTGRTRVLGPTHPWTISAQGLLNHYRETRRED
ncbi:tetratricopeptide repeat protein [Streptomyces griseoviridis]|uniref:ATP/GTP-binding protein n=1 Tax=Streptomyces griseoviridis TaxID=45398 RepID=A0A3S9ZDP6_STRGD|nr:tetratricopeptide repeat protein [Streptomyces griseoviridis]AZS85951.1 tetratricopeptide repeat protein [Streptomyces griseoviridis]QCN87189.1 ATP/GTP-binding protein [Streptomyces griseoviridis]